MISISSSGGRIIALSDRVTAALVTSNQRLTLTSIFVRASRHPRSPCARISQRLVDYETFVKVSGIDPRVAVELKKRAWKWPATRSR
jgi:hypothetical protein